MRVGILSVFQDHHRRGLRSRGVLQPQAGPLIAALLPPAAEIELINDAWAEPPWERDYDLLLVSCLHPDFDRARQISAYWRNRGARTVLGGPFASTHPHLAAPWFDSVVVGDPEDTVPALYADALRGELKPLYRSAGRPPGPSPVPRFDLANPDILIPISLELSRGCPFACRFCGQTSIGPRYLTRPVAEVVRDIRAAQAGLRGRMPEWKSHLALFVDNNIGGHPGWLRELCDALEPLDLTWGSSATFNVIADPGLVTRLSRAGCRQLYVGLESFNPVVLQSMKKLQNRVDEYRRALDGCHRAGIVVVSGIVLSPEYDGLDYLESLPRLLHQVGMDVPTFVAFEAPIPGTPLFADAVARGPGALLPGTLLRDLTGYTLATRPTGVTPERYVEAYKALLGTLFAPSRRAGWIARSGAAWLRHAQGWSALLHASTHVGNRHPVVPGRSYLAGSDTAPPSTVPLRPEDGAEGVAEPWRVAGATGEVLSRWRGGDRTGVAGS